MNKNFAIVLSCAVTVLGLASCGNKETDLLKPESKTHTVVFDAQAPAATETKTALHLQVIPDWRNTDVNDVHIFEKETTTSGSYMMEASRVLMETNDDYTKARFYAEFDNASVIVNPPVMETKASSSQFNYTAIMATREGDKYMVPSVQYPHEQSLIDPKADFLVGGSDETYNETLHEQTFLLDFLRPVALARLAITNLEGTKVNEVKITTANYITGFATYDDVDFENKTVEFQGDESNKVLTLLYPEGKKKTTTFYAYFVCMPGEIQFSEIKVYTDQYVFTKTYASPASLTLKGGDFMNIALDMTPKDNNGVTKTGLEAQTLTFNDNNEQPVVEAIEYDIYEHDGIEAFQDIAPQLIVGEDVVDPSLITFESSNEDVATVDEEGVVTLTGTIGEATITAKVPGDATHAAGSASYKIIVTDSTPAPANPKFYKADELVDGQEYIIVSNGMAMTLVEETTTGTKANVTLTLDAVEVNAIDGVIETDENVAVWTASTQVEYYTSNNQSHEAGHFALQCGDVYLQRLSNNSDQTLIVGDIPSTGKYYVWDYDGEYLSHLSSATTTFYVGYNDGWGVVYNGTLPKVTLYTTTKPLTKQTISFGEQPVTAKYDLNIKEWTVAVPELTGAQTTVTYSSDNDAIEVDASTGAINITDDAKKGDKATITATAAQTEEYASAKATYTIEILDSSEPQPTGTTYYLTAKPEDVVSGDYLVVSYDYDRIFDGSGDNKGGYTLVTADGISADKTAGTITVSNDAKASLEFAITRTDNTLTLKNALGFLKHNGANDDPTFITFDSNSGSSFTLDPTITTDANKAIYFWTPKGSNSTSQEYLYYKDSGSGTLNVFKIGGSGNNATKGGVHLYFAGERTAQSISFGKTEDTYDMASEDPYVALTLSGEPKTQVNYSSSDTSVATVDANGAVTIVGKGETTITATAPASSEYLSATASYTLTVTNSKVPTYYKVDELENGQKYLIVSNGYALALNGTTVSSAAVTATETEGEIKFDEQDNAIWTATVSGTSIKVKNGNNYLRHSSNTTTNFSISTTDSNNGITYDADNNTVKLGSNYLYYSSGFKLSASAGDTHVAAFYSATKPLTKQTIAFAETIVQYDLNGGNGSVSAPEWAEGKAPQTTVTYATESTIVSVNESTGEVTVLNSAKKGDTATITATAEQTEVYASAKATFTINIVDSSTPDEEKYYVLVTSEPASWNGKYLIVNTATDGTGTAMNGTATASVTISGGKILSNETIDGYALTVASAGEVHPNQTNSSEQLIAYDIKFSDGDWLYWYSSQYKQTSEDQSTRHNKCTLLYDNGGVRLMSAGYNVNLSGQTISTPSKNYLYYSSGSYKMSSSSANERVQLYKLEGSGGTTPEPPTPSTNTTYTRISTHTGLESGTYIIVSSCGTADKSGLWVFTGDGTNYAGSVSSNSGNISLSTDKSTITISGETTAYEFEITRNGDVATLKNMSKGYLFMDRRADGNTSQYIGFSKEFSDIPTNNCTGEFTIDKPESVSTDANAVFFYAEYGSSNQYLYSKDTQNSFKIGGSGAPNQASSNVYYGGVLLYKKNTSNN